MKITAENVNDIINIDYSADAYYHDDGSIDFMLEPKGDLTNILMQLLGVDTIGYWDDYNAYIVIENNGELYGGIEFTYMPEEGDQSYYYYRFDEEEEKIVMDRIREEIKSKFYMSLEEMLEDADPDK